MEALFIAAMVLLAGVLIARHEQAQERAARRWFRRHMGWEREEDGG